MFHLQFFRNEQPIFTHILHRETLVGRSDRCDVSLPSSDISRKHCLFTQKEGVWWVEDLSKHGITVDGRPQKKSELRHGTQIGIMDFSCQFLVGWESTQKTKEIPISAEHMFIMSADNEIHTYSSYLLVSVQGEKKQISLSQARLSVGGGDSDILITDPKLRPHHCFFRVSRGRVMVEPGAGPVIFDGQMLHSITPLFPDDELRIGDTSITILDGTHSERPSKHFFGSMKSEVEEMQRIFGMLERFAQHHFHVLIQGESGTGKEVAARALHEASPRRDHPFVAINCGSLPTDLIESELFGHEKGAFTGAIQTKKGAFQLAAGGTLFLDELGELSLSAQTKLLRVLESGEVRKVGGERVEFPNVRIVAATNRNLMEMIDNGHFREDLFYRISCLSVILPPLRSRLSDISTLAKDILSSLDTNATISQAAVQVLCTHHWPGNIREFRNVLIRAYVLQGKHIDAKGIEFQDLIPKPLQPIPTNNEKKYIEQLLSKYNGNRSAVARELGLSRSTLLYRLKRYELV